MVAKDAALFAVAGAGLGALGAIVFLGSNNRPRIDASLYTVPAGGAYTLFFVGFPPNTQLIGPNSLNPLSTVNIGTTNSSGALTINTNAASTAGRYAVIAWDAPTGKYCGVVIITVT